MGRSWSSACANNRSATEMFTAGNYPILSSPALGLVPKRDEHSLRRENRLRIDYLANERTNERNGNWKLEIGNRVWSDARCPVDFDFLGSSGSFIGEIALCSVTFSVFFFFSSTFIIDYILAQNILQISSSNLYVITTTPVSTVISKLSKYFTWKTHNMFVHWVRIASMHIFNSIDIMIVTTLPRPQRQKIVKVLCNNSQEVPNERAALNILNEMINPQSYLSTSLSLHSTRCLIKLFSDIGCDSIRKRLENIGNVLSTNRNRL